MNLLKMRFENSLFYELPTTSINPEAKVVPLSLQLLLENTFKHTVEKRSGLCTITIAVQEREGNVMLSVEDDLGVLSTNSTQPQGIGLDNLRQRLALMKDAQANLQIQNRPQGGVRTEIMITAIAQNDA